jgi:hypothetical protein
VYQGHYGPWSIEPEDVAEVWSYRIGLSATTAGGHARRGSFRVLQQQAGSLCQQQKLAAVPQQQQQQVLLRRFFLL